MATLQELEAELRQNFQKQNYVEAMDIYEEIERVAGALKPQHLVGRAQCYLKLRRKQDAKIELMRAHQIDPAFQPTLHMLNENFPGWDGGAPASQPAFAPQAQPAMAAASARPAAPASAHAHPVAESAPWAPAPTPAPAYQSPAPAYQSPAPAYAPAPRSFQSAPPPQGANPAAANAARVNWNYVTEDLKAARGGRAAN